MKYVKLTLLTIGLPAFGMAFYSAVAGAIQITATGSFDSLATLFAVTFGAAAIVYAWFAIDLIRNWK